MKRLSLGTRLLLGFLLAALLPLAGLAWFYLYSFEQSLTATVLQNISSIADKKSDQIEHYIEERLADARLYAAQPGLKAALNTLATSPGEEARRRVAQSLRRELQALREERAFHDILLIDLAGNVVFSLREEPDLGTNLLDGPYQDTVLASGFRQATTFLHVDLTRFAPYAPSAEQVAAFAVAPVVQAGRPIGALALQVSLDSLRPIVLDPTGMGRSGETVIALQGQGGVQYAFPLRDHEAVPFVSRYPESGMAEPMRLSLRGEHGRGLVRDQRGHLVAASWQFLPSLNWGMVAKIDVDEALAPLRAKQQLTILAFAFFLMLSLAIGYLLGRRFLQAEYLIAAQEARYRGTFGSMTDGVALYEPTPDHQRFRILDINPAGERIGRVRREEVIGRWADEVFPGLEQAGILPAFRRVSAGGDAESVSLTAYADDRLNLWVENDVIRLPGGEIMSIFKDITERKQAQEALMRSVGSLREAQRIARIGNWQLDLRQHRMVCSDELLRILELTQETTEWSEQRLLARVHPEDRARVEAARAACAQDGEPYEVTYRLLQPDGECKHLVERGECRRDRFGGQLLLLGTVQDITERQRAEEALTLYANIFRHSGEAIMVTDHENRIVAVNPAFTRQTGYALSEIFGQNPRLLSSGHTPPETYQMMWSALRESGYWQGELWDRNRNGMVYPKWAAMSAIRDEDGRITHYIASFTDISERKAAEQRIEHLAHHDSLTGLFNRYNLEIRLSQALLLARREENRLAVMFIDLDRFKVINDTLGHHTGDLLLIEVARRLQGCVRESDIVARQGGDEFVVVLPGLSSPDDASPVAAKILHRLGEPYDIDGERLHSSPSIGISIYPDDGEDAETLMKNADTAMYHAKERGRNNMQYFTAALNAAAGERLMLERELRKALEARQFELHYQPQFLADDTGKRVPHAVEALIRWRHPQLGMISPARFIPVAEETGMIEPIGDWVLDEACRQLAVWRDRGIGPGHVAVNLSAQQLRSPELVAKVAACLARHAIERDALELEITESVAMQDPAGAIEQLQALRALGVTLAIDDFGTGYSSLAYLKRLPIQVLKIDREFVRDIETDENDAAISAATLALAHSLGLKVVAEGIETPGQGQFLREHGCDLLQGYLYGRPEPAADLEQRWQLSV